jgi:hypothetical protein
MKQTKYSKIGLLSGIALSAVLTGCVVAPPQRVVYAEPPPVYVETVVVHGGYVYYPGYQVYYSGNSRQYVYLEGSAWVTRPAPPRVSVDVLFASPSVTLDFQDAPATHHASVVRQYPKNWKPPGTKSNHGQDKKNQGNGNGNRNGQENSKHD